MARSKVFKDQPKSPARHKSLRLHAREAAEYLTGRPYLPPKVPNWPAQKPGRGANGESAS